MGKTVQAIQADSSLAAFQYRATNRWISGGHNRLQIRSFYGAGQEDRIRTVPFVLEADEPSVLLGEDHGANPVEYVLHALAACLTTSLVYHAAARATRVESVESQLEGDLDLQGFLGISDKVHERLCCTRRYAAATSRHAPLRHADGQARPSRPWRTAQVRLGLSALHVPVSLGVLAVPSLDWARDPEQVEGSRAVMNNVG